MKEPQLIQKDTLYIVGFSFFGDPFRSHAGWTEENEIGRLWNRFLSYSKINQPDPALFVPGNYFEIHTTQPETNTTGEYEVFVGMEVASPAMLNRIPVEMLVKVLPACMYAVFTMAGSEINSDWHIPIYQEWMSSSGYSEAFPFALQLYDERYKGLDRLEESILDVYIPVKESHAS